MERSDADLEHNPSTCRDEVVKARDSQATTAVKELTIKVGKNLLTSKSIIDAEQTRSFVLGNEIAANGPLGQACKAEGFISPVFVSFFKKKTTRNESLSTVITNSLGDCYKYKNSVLSGDCLRSRVELFSSGHARQFSKHGYA